MSLILSSSARCCALACAHTSARFVPLSGGSVCCKGSRAPPARATAGYVIHTASHRLHSLRTHSVLAVHLVACSPFFVDSLMCTLRPVPPRASPARPTAALLRSPALCSTALQKRAFRDRKVLLLLLILTFLSLFQSRLFQCDLCNLRRSIHNLCGRHPSSRPWHDGMRP